MIKTAMRKLKLNNKKGFSLVELLVAVAIIAIMTPILYNGFTLAVKLNYRSRLQQRADAAANSVYEGIASLKYEELEDYFSSLNNWQDINEDGSGYEYVVTKYYDELEDCKVTVSVQKYSESYVVPDLNFIGVKSKYLTLASEVNNLDATVSNRIEQAIKSNDEIKTAIKYDVVEQIKSIYGVELSVNDVDGSRMLINCGNIDEAKISKQTNVELETYNGQFIANYSTSYRYPANNPNPAGDTGALVVGYSYSHKVGGKWVSVSNSAFNVREAYATKLPDSLKNTNYQFVTEGYRGSSAVAIDGDASSPQNLFIYYNPVSKMDWMTFDSSSLNTTHNVFLIEQGSKQMLSFFSGNAKDSKNNFAYKTAVVSVLNDYVDLMQESNTKIRLYSNVRNWLGEDEHFFSIPDTIYESSEGESNMYRVKVEVVYHSNVFADVSGSFSAGGGTVNQYTK